MSVAGQPPGWLRTIADAVGEVTVDQLSRHAPPEPGAGRASAVLTLFGESVIDGRLVPDVLLIERPQPRSPYGIKGVGEIGLVPTAGAVAAALHDLDGEWRAALPMRRNGS